MTPGTVSFPLLVPPLGFLQKLTRRNLACHDSLPQGTYPDQHLELPCRNTDSLRNWLCYCLPLDYDSLTNSGYLLA